MKRYIMGVSILMLIFSTVSLAQQAGSVPSPGSEHKRLNAFTGSWNSEGEAKQGPFGPAGKFTGKSTVEWLPGGFFLVMREEGKGPMGEIKSLAVLGYDSKKKVYTFNGFDSMGNAEVYTGTVKGQVWTWTADLPEMQGKKMKGKFTLTEVSPTSNSMKFEYSEDSGATWKLGMEGKQTKAK